MPPNADISHRRLHTQVAVGRKTEHRLHIVVADRLPRRVGRHDDDHDPVIRGTPMCLHPVGCFQGSGTAVAREEQCFWFHGILSLYVH